MSFTPSILPLGEGAWTVALGDRVDRGIVVGVIAQPQPWIPALDSVIPCDVQARVRRLDLVDGGHTAILPAPDARLML